jgi:hypothetical protein
VAIGFVAGAIVGYFFHDSVDTGCPNAVVVDQSNFVTTWYDFIESWDNAYIKNNADMVNFMNMYNLTYLDSVRRAEHEVADFVDYTVWQDVIDNMTTIEDFKHDVLNMLIYLLHGYNFIDVSLISYMYDSIENPLIDYVDAYTTHINGDLLELSTHHSRYGTFPTQYVGLFYPDEIFYVTYLYIPTGKNLTMQNMVTNVTSTFNESGIVDLKGELYKVVSGDFNEAYLFGIPSDYDILNPSNAEFGVNSTGVNANTNQSIVFGSQKYISGVTIEGTGNYKIYLDGELFDTGVIPEGIDNIIHIDENATTIDVQSNNNGNYFATLLAPSYIYNSWYFDGLVMQTDLAGGVNISSRFTSDPDQLYANRMIGLYSMTDSYVNIYNAMITQAKILWDLYHSLGWYETDDIPSDFLVIPPDIIFDNLGSLENLPVDIAELIYNAWMAQLIQWYQDHPNATGVYNDYNQSMPDIGIEINCSLTHGGNDVITDKICYISPLLETLCIETGESYILTQGIFILQSSPIHVYYGYTGDNLTINSITVDNESVDSICLERTVMHDFLMENYGINLSFPAEWTPPVIEELPSFTMWALLSIGGGIVLAIIGSASQKLKILKTIGILLIVVGSIYLLWVYIIQPVGTFFGWL